MRIAREEPVNSNLNSDKLVSVLVEKSIRYRVRSGDNLGLIAQRYHVSVKQLKAWNHLRSDRINAGQTLVIHTKKREWVKPTVEPEPKGSDDEEPTNSIVPVTNTSAITPHVRGSEPLSYTVRSGDSLFGRHGAGTPVSAEPIREVNGIGNNIHPGQDSDHSTTMRPTQVLAFLLVVLAGLGLVGLLVPEGGIPFSNAFTFRAPDPATVLFDKEPEQVDISDILAVTTDSAAVLSNT